MEQKLNQMIKWICILLLALIGISCMYLVFLTVTAYSPEPIIDAELYNTTNELHLIPTRTPLSIVSYNLGFGAHSTDFDYYKEGGTTVRVDSEEIIIDNLTESIELLLRLQSDFMMLQEVDRGATRSYYIDQLDSMTRIFSDYSYAFSPNFIIKWLATPFSSMQGKFYSGLSTFSTTPLHSVKKITLPSTRAWPFYLTDYQPALLVSRMPTEDDKELVLINVHLGMPTQKGEDIRLQLEALYTLLEEEYAKGNYIIAGGSFQHLLPIEQDVPFSFEETETLLNTTLPLLPDSEHFRFIGDPLVPTTRDASIPYQKGTSFVGITDGFIVSNNIDVLSVQTIDTGFGFSNHHPVTMVFELD